MVRNELHHHGITGMKWGTRLGPPYPLTKDRMNTEERRDNLVSKWATSEIKKHGKPDAKTNYTVKRSSSSSTTNSTTSTSTGGSGGGGGGGGGGNTSSNEDSYAKQILKNFQPLAASSSKSKKGSSKKSTAKKTADKKAKEAAAKEKKESQEIAKKQKEELAKIKKEAQKVASKKRARQANIDRLLGTRLSMVSGSSIDPNMMKRLREDLRKLSDIL